MSPASEAPTPSGNAIRTEEEKYRSLLFSDNLVRHFPRFSGQLRQQRDDTDRANWGRACVLEFQEGEPTTVEDFCKPEQLSSHFLKPKTTSRRLWLLEDVSLSWITILGAHLRIPPSFFASHWADPSGADFNDRHTFSPNPERCFLLKYPQFQRVRVRGLEKDLRHPILAITCNVERYFFVSGFEDTTYENPDFARSYHNLSFWSSEHPNRDWEAVLLVDPPLRDLWYMDHQDYLEGREIEWSRPGQNTPQLLSHRSFYPAINESEILPQDYNDWNTSKPVPDMFSMYDDIKECVPEWEREVDGCPKSCTSFGRKLVIAIWLDFVRRRYSNLLIASTLGSVSRCKTGYANRTGWLNKPLDFLYEENIFGNLINAHHKQASLLFEISANMRALGLPLSSHACGEKVRDAWERHGWNEVRIITNHIAGMMNLLTQAYQHSVTMKETQTGNNVAKGVARITNIAIIVTPMTTIAAIFSMGKPFAVGESYWWVFWVICCPALLLFLLFFLGHEIKLLLCSPGKFIGTFIRKQRQGKEQKCLTASETLWKQVLINKDADLETGEPVV